MTREESIERFNGIINAMSISIAQSKFYPSKAELDELCNMAIEALSADAVQGEWIDVENEPYCECSVCGSYIDNLDDDYAFCPRCGARMKGGAE